MIGAMLSSFFRIRTLSRFLVIMILTLLGPGHITLSGASPGADVLYGDTLMSYCAGGTDTDLGLCSGYIMAVAESMADGQFSFGHRSCGHDAIRAQQLVDLVKIEVSEHPDMKVMPAGVMVAGILARSFPCYGDISPAAGGLSR